MKVNIYYGGRGLLEDPTIYALDLITEVLKEIRVEVTRYNLYEDKNTIAMLPRTLKEADGVILAVNVEWLGIGGYMTQFLDSCWLYGDKEKISSLYMMPVVLSNTIGEKEAQLMLVKAWEMLGGVSTDGICAYVEDHIEFETNDDYKYIIEKKTEDLYRTIKQKPKMLPASHTVMKREIRSMLPLTPQESEQLSVYVSDDTYVKRQKEDIEELTQMFRGMLSKQGETEQKDEFITKFQQSFCPVIGLNTTYSIQISDMKRSLILEIQDTKLNCYYGTVPHPNVDITITSEVLRKIMDGRSTFQRAFMAAELTAKGTFHAIKAFDDFFVFRN